MLTMEFTHLSRFSVYRVCELVNSDVEHVRERESVADLLLMLLRERRRVCERERETEINGALSKLAEHRKRVHFLAPN